MQGGILLVAEVRWMRDVMECGCGDLRGVDEMYLAPSEGDPVTWRAECIDCVVGAGFDFETLVCLGDVLRPPGTPGPPGGAPRPRSRPPRASGGPPDPAPASAGS